MNDATAIETAIAALGDLHRRGIISDDEYAMGRAQAISTIVAPAPVAARGPITTPDGSPERPDVPPPGSPNAATAIAPAPPSPAPVAGPDEPPAVEPVPTRPSTTTRMLLTAIAALLCLVATFATGLIAGLMLGDDSDPPAADAVVPFAEGTTATLSTAAGGELSLAINHLFDPAESPAGRPPAENHRFVAIDVLVQNTGEVDVDTPVWVAVTSDGNKFPRRLAAGLGGDLPTAASLAPGQAASGLLVFELPADTSIAAIVAIGEPRAGSDITFGDLQP